MPSDDWELFTVKATAPARQRLTREIQHDLLPRFLGNDRLLGLIGEAAAPPVVHLRPRHRPRAMRLFHNNTVRTIAPEYEWVAEPRRHQGADRRRARRRHRVARARRLPDRPDAQGHARRAAGAAAGERSQPRKRCAPRASGCSRRSPPPCSGGRRGGVGRPHLRLREDALRLRLEAHHAAGQQAGVQYLVRHLQVVRLRAGDAVVRRDRSAPAARPPTSSPRCKAPSIPSWSTW